MRTLSQYNFRNKQALVRVDFNVPLDSEFRITDDTRIKAALPTIRKVISDGGSTILMSHLGRPKEGPVKKYSLQHLVSRLSELTGVRVIFADDCIGPIAFEKAQNLKPGEILLLENLRFYKEEEKGEIEFSRKLSQLGNVYVNDAFGTAHREHASTTIVEKFFPNDKVCGYLMQAELDNASKVLQNPSRPLTAIMGGVKISDKILVIEKLLDKVDNLLIGGAMAFTFFKALGGKTGNSLVENDKLELATQLVKMADSKKVNLMLPDDSVASESINNSTAFEIYDSMNIPENRMGLDIGPEARKKYSNVIKNSKTILWNGPVGVFEMANFSGGTKAIAQAIADATSLGAYSLIGGGDSAAAVNSLGYGKNVSYVSTGGGALLEYFEGKELPGVAALN